jgi:hypothetical protein
MLTEAVVMNWLSNGARPNGETARTRWLHPAWASATKQRFAPPWVRVDACAGMVVRMQGFDKGVFGGNYHTHNMIATPPGLDVVCFSNGWDWVTSSAVFDSAFS